MGLCMACVQGGYVRRIPHGKELTAAMTVSALHERLVNHSTPLRRDNQVRLA